MSISTRVNQNLKLTAYTNAGFATTVFFKTKINGVVVPLDLTNYQIYSQIRNLDDELAASFVVTKTNAAAGETTFSLDVDVLRLVEPGTYYYDVLLKNGSNDPTNAWTAAFVVEDGVTAWPIA